MKLKCFACENQFEYTDEPINAFTGYLLGDDDKAKEPEITLCLTCYHHSILSTTGFYRKINPNFYSYPLKWRAKNIPDGPTN